MTYLIAKQSPQQVAEELIKDIINKANECKNQYFFLFLSGGKTPEIMFKQWVNKFADHTPWGKFVFLFVDERCVPPTHIESNYKMVKEVFFNNIPIPPNRVFRIKGENDPNIEINDYIRRVALLLCVDNIEPHYVVLGLGDDGHTSSVFPGENDLLTTNVNYVKSYKPNTLQARVGLSINGIRQFENIAFFVCGTSKQEAMQKLLNEDLSIPAAWVAKNKMVKIFADFASVGK